MTYLGFGALLMGFLYVLTNIYFSPRFIKKWEGLNENKNIIDQCMKDLR